MGELMGICGADAQTTTGVLDRMAANIDRSGGLRADRWEGPGFGLLRFGHGAINPERQPVANEDGTRLAALDGELFDTGLTRRRLATAGHRFRFGDNDAELVVHLVEQAGHDAFVELNGSFAAAVYEPGRRRLLLATDRSFSRPLYYCWRGGALAFSSRFNSLAGCGVPDAGRLDMTAVMTFFTFDDLHDTMTYYRQVRAMPPAAVLHFEGGRLAVRRYWRPRYGVLAGNEAEQVERLADALRRAARRMTRDDCRKGLMLSGGLDARALLAAADVPMKTYTTADYVNREARIARRVARAAGCPNLFLPRQPDHYAAMIDEAVELTGGMGRFDHCHFLGQLDRPRAECDVVFVEEPMDRMFKGHYWHRRWLIRGMRVPLPLKTRPARQRIEEQILRLDAKSAYHSRPWLLFREPWRSRYHRIMSASIRMQLADADTDDPYHLVEHVAGQRVPGRIASFQNIACVRPYLEYRSICLDNDLRDLSVQMPARFRMGGRLLAQAIRRLNPRLHAVPYANTGVRLDTPAPVAWACCMAAEAKRAIRQRLGRLPRTHTNEAWSDRAEVARTPAFRRILEQTLTDSDSLEPSLFDTAHVGRLLEEHMARAANHTNLLMCLLTFGRWFSKYGPRTV